MIIRADKNQGNYTQISNDIINDINLTAKAKGIALYILSKSDNWKFYQEEIAKNFADGITAINAGLKELEKHGYLVKNRTHVDGRLTWEYIFYENTIHRFSMDRNSMDRNTTDRKPQANNTNINNTNLSKTDLKQTATDTAACRRAVELIDAAFRERYYIAYGKEFSNDDSTNLIAGIEEFYTAMQDMQQERDDEWFNVGNEQMLKDIFDWFFQYKRPQKPYLPVLTSFLDYTCDYNHDAFIDWKERQKQKQGNGKKQKQGNGKKKVNLKGQELKQDTAIDNIKVNINDVDDPEDLPFKIARIIKQRF